MNSCLNRITTNCFDYNILIESLSDLAFPRNAIGQMIKSGKITRVKKGIYAKSDGRSASRWVLANMIYGPSYVSSDFVLSACGLIPERVFTVTSMSTKRRRSFDTALGRFEYQTIPIRAFIEGVVHHTLEDGSGYMAALPEKALADRLANASPVTSLADLSDLLFEDWRVDRERFASLSRTRMNRIARVYRRSSIHLLAELLTQVERP